MKIKTSFLLLMIGILTMGFVPRHVQRKYAAVESQIHRMLKDKYNITIGGSGGSAPDEIRSIMIYIDSHKYYTIDQTRKMYVQIVEEIIKQINSIKEVRPYLHSYPVDESFVNLKIAFKKIEGQPEVDNLVYYVCKTTKGIIAYMSEKDKKSARKTVHREPYIDALQKVKGNQKDLLN